MQREYSGPVQVAGYVLSGRIGSGGMGDVYKAWHPGLQRHAAVKVLHQKEMADRFRNEAFIQSGVNHPNIARWYESSLTGAYPAIVMELVEGEPLDEHLRRVGRIPNAAAANILRQVAGALAYLHARDIMHRDIKPSNFRIGHDGTVKMLDFGIARHKYSPKLTQQGFIVGTTEYMAPEQFNQQVEKHSDIWSLGVMLYEMITGHLPFEAVNPLVLQGKILRATFTDPKILVQDLSPQLIMIIEKSLRVNPASRITAEALSRMLSDQANRGKIIANSRLVPKAYVMIGAVALLAFLIMLFLIRLDPVIAPVIPPDGSEPVRELKGSVYSVRINAPGVSNASILFTDGNSKALPADVTGQEGEQVQFVLRADGYEDKHVTLGINSRRGAYDYNLDKLKE